MKNNILKNYFLNIVMVFTSIIFPILVFPYSSRVLTPTNYGKYSFSFSIASYFLVFSIFGAQSYGVRELSYIKNKDQKQFIKVLNEIVLITFITSLISFVIYILTIFFIKSLRKEFFLFFILGLQILFNFLSIDYYYIAIENHKRRTIRLLFIKIISLICLFMWVKKSEDYIIFTLIMIIPEIIAKIIDFYMIRKLINFDFKVLNLKKHIKSMLIIFFYIFSTSIYLNLDSTMLGFMKGEKEVGYYAVAMKMTKIIIPVITSLGVVLTPRIIKNIKENQRLELFKDMDFYLDFIFFIASPVIFILILCSDNLIFLFSGQSYKSAILPMKIMLPIILFISLSGFSASQILIPTNNEKMVFKVSMIGLIVNIILNYLLIPKYSLLGAGIATLVAEFFVCIFRMLEVKKIYSDYKILSIDRIQYLVFSLIGFKFTFFVKNKVDSFSDLFQIIIISSIYLFIYLIFLIAFKNSFIKKILTKFKIIKY